MLLKDSLCFESRKIGMELQYKIEAHEEVEGRFVQVDYEARDYDQHVVRKIPELLEKEEDNRLTICHKQGKTLVTGVIVFSDAGAEHGQEMHVFNENEELNGYGFSPHWVSV